MDTVGLETVSVGAICLALISTLILLIKKHFETDKSFRKSLDDNTRVIGDLRLLLLRINGYSKGGEKSEKTD